MADRRVPLTMVDYYGLWNKPLSAQQFYRIGTGMFGGPRGVYGRASYGPVTSVNEMKGDRERQSGE